MCVKGRCFVLSLLYLYLYLWRKSASGKFKTHGGRCVSRGVVGVAWGGHQSRVSQWNVVALFILVHVRVLVLVLMVRIWTESLSMQLCTCPWIRAHVQSIVHICKGLSSSKPFISTFTLSLHSHPKEREENKKPKQWKGGISGRKMRRKSQSSEQPASHDGRVRGWGFCGHRGWPQCWYRHNRWLSKLFHLYLCVYMYLYF